MLFVGTKKQAQDRCVEAANRCGMPYVNTRWLGGMLTNFVTIRSRVNRMEELEAMQTDGRMEWPCLRRSRSLLMKELAKLQTNLNGIRNMKKLPDAIFAIDTNREDIAIREATSPEHPRRPTRSTPTRPDGWLRQSVQRRRHPFRQADDRVHGRRRDCRHQRCRDR